MLLSYGMSHVGSSHISKGVPCQDSNRIVTLPNEWIVAAIADGVGSARHSDIASNLATEKFVSRCENDITPEMSAEEIKEVILSAFYDANTAIRECASENDHIITEYDTTLSGVVYTGKTVIYGHSGDGGIVGLTNSGDYVLITKPQKAEDGICVIPLRAGESSWEFGVCENEFASVLMVTDGVYDVFTPYLLRDQQMPLYIPLIRYFMDNNVLKLNQDNCSEVAESRINFINGDKCKSITDDKTIVVLVNSDIKPEMKEEDYYKEPDWAKLQDDWNRRAYPHLYKKQEDSNVPTNESITNENEVEDKNNTKKSILSRFRKTPKEGD